jgi:hypothetical protein
VPQEQGDGRQYGTLTGWCGEGKASWRNAVTDAGWGCWLAEHINDQVQLARQGAPLDSSIGLTTPLKPISTAHDIGSFPQSKCAAVVQRESSAPTTVSMPGLKPKPIRPTSR